jgi:hypothetical protein
LPLISGYAVSELVCDRYSEQSEREKATGQDSGPVAEVVGIGLA